jgi:23S rRNA pseudouridine1911/1915/1917 synthase
MTAETVRLTVPPEAHGLRLDVFLAARIAGRSRSALRRLVDQGAVTVDGQPASKPGLALQRGMRLEVRLPEPPSDRLEPEEIPIEVVHEDRHLVVVVKPAGRITHPGHGARTGTLVHALLGRGTPLAPAGGVNRPGIVHRLDKDTSGLVVVAKTDPAHRGLIAAFSQRLIEKTYLALVWGRMEPDQGRVETPIGRSRSDPTKMSVRSPRGRPAATRWRTVESIPGFSLLEIGLETGRTHQIRVHLQSLHHPIVGDTRYGGPAWKGIQDPVRRKALQGFRRLALHSAALAFEHPVTGEPLRFVAPLPDDFVALLRVLRGEL